MRLIFLGLALASTAVPAAAKEAAKMLFECDAKIATVEGGVPNLRGNWDFLMDVRGNPNFGLLSVGLAGDAYGGSLALWSTAPVVLRKLTVAGNSFHLAVDTPDGDVLFDGTLSAKGDRMCGTVTYHGGRTFPAVARKRPTTYEPRPAAQRAR